MKRYLLESDVKFKGEKALICVTNLTISSNFSKQSSSESEKMLPQRRIFTGNEQERQFTLRLVKVSRRSTTVVIWITKPKEGVSRSIK